MVHWKGDYFMPKRFCVYCGYPATDTLALNVLGHTFEVPICSQSCVDSLLTSLKNTPKLYALIDAVASGRSVKLPPRLPGYIVRLTKALENKFH